MAVGGKREVQRFAVGGAQRCQFSNEFYKPALQQRLAACQTHLAYTQVDKQLDQAEVLINSQLGILRPHFAGSAIDAFVIAAVGDGDAEIVNDPPVAVFQPCIGSGVRRENWGSNSHRQPLGYTFLDDCG